MRTEPTRPGGRRRRWHHAPLAVATMVLMLVAAACGGGGGGGQAGGGAPPPNPSDAPPEAAAITATFGEFPLPQGTPGAGKPPIAIGSKDFSEQDLLNELYSQALRAKGYTVTSQAGIGSTEVIDRVFAANQIQMYPEYLGVLVTGPAGQQTNPPNAQATYDVAQQFVQSQRQARLFLQTPFQNVDTIIVKPEYAQRFGLQTVQDLNKVAPGGQGVRLAAQPSFQTRESGLVGMGRAYGLTNMNPSFIGISAGAQVYQALDAGQADAGDGFSTDSQLLTGQYVQLQDPANIFGSQYVAPVVKQATAQQMGPEFEQTCNWVSGLLTTQAIQQMNQAVSGGQNEADVARSFLQQNGLR